MVGDQMIRGISGGEKKRVTTGEMLVGPAKALFMDEISTGLDSSTTYSIVNSLRQSIHILGGTALIALLQPAPETYDLFDDIVLLSEGQIVYQGPREHVLEFFESMGFRCPERKGVADFLQEVTSRKDQQQYWALRDEPYRFVSVTEFSNAFISFHVGRKLERELSTPFDKRKNHPAALTTSRYGVSNMDLLKACFSREFLLMKRNSFVYIFKIFQLILIATIAMTVFLRTKMHHRNPDDGVIYMGALFIGLITHLFNGFAELAMGMAKLPVFYKQRDLLFFPAWAYAVPTWILKIPVSFLECAVYTSMTYYVIGFDPNVQRFFRQFLLFALLSQTASGLFRVVAAIGREMTVANSFGSFAQLVVIVLGGFILSRENIKKFWIWGYWASPLMYAQNAITVNEFLGNKWQHDATKSNKTIGVQVLESRGLFPESKWFWIGAAALVGYVLLFNVVYTAALTFLDKRGMVLPFEPLSLTFDDVKYSVDMPAEMKAQGVQEDRLMLLKGVSGAFRPGVLTALVGISGAGKTTLMDVLAGRKTGGYIEGNINISGYPKKQETFARISGYCEQNDIHSPHVTVYESLIYSAWLRLSPEVDANTRKMFVEEVMELVELTPLRKALVGLPGVNGLSTEQRKRLTIAVELVANPSIIFMDEPTSGLDARAAAIVMRTVRNTVDTGRTVVCTIHQPSIDIFEAFDEQLFLMKRGGEEIYVGPLGRNSCELIRYFEGVNGVSKIKDGYNPATWMLEVTNFAQEDILGVNFSEIYKSSDLFRRNKALISELSTPALGSKELYFPAKFSQPFFSQCLACFWKQYKSYWRNPSYGAIRMFFTTVTAFIFGTIFWRVGSKTSTKQDLFNALGSMYGAVMFIGVQNSQTVQPVVDVERTVFYREKAAGMYSPLPYAFAQVAIEVPYTLFQSVVYGALVYIMMDFQWTLVKFLWYLLFTFCTFLYFTYYGMMAVSLTPNSDIAAIVASAFYAIWNLFAGFVIPRPRIPVWWRWYFWACPVAWTLYGLSVSQFGDLDDWMEDAQQPVKAFIEDYFGYKHDFLGAVAVVEIGFPLLFAIVFAFAIKVLNFQRR
ncbi:Pleiotropic drug resistance protein TUR2 [Apostasia shenzhenica]|uniref:Pleiotropic drug resistance protein TUR2 n=1 Tax=Apostasia shenzhenica TaxID=1088818 RepID=A0A2I0B9S1_9ASPA|nr:Pleiotropic drug resistance protein TUR2 [Apostasia shenzhenica]